MNPALMILKAAIQANKKFFMHVHPDLYTMLVNSGLGYESFEKDLGGLPRWVMFNNCMIIQKRIS